MTKSPSSFNVCYHLIKYDLSKTWEKNITCKNLKQGWLLQSKALEDVNLLARNMRFNYFQFNWTVARGRDTWCLLTLQRTVVIAPVCVRPPSLVPSVIEKSSDDAHLWGNIESNQTHELVGMIILLGLNLLNFSMITFLRDRYTNSMYASVQVWDSVS